MKTEPSIFARSSQPWNLGSCLIASFHGWRPSLNFSGKPRNQGRRGVDMVQWNAEKLSSLKARKLEWHLFWLWFWFLRPWSQAPRLDLRSGKNTVEHVLSSRPGERRLILSPEGFMLYSLGARSLGCRYNTKSICCMCTP